jgi:hypothetical protein
MSCRKPRRSSDSELDKRSREIASCIRQADEYYKAADTVGLATHPLLQFYGAECLAKAVVLANNPSIWLSDINYHGLTTRANTAADSSDRAKLQAYSKDSSIWTIEDEFAVTNKGVFLELCQTIGESVPEGAVLNLKDLFKILPDLANLYRRHYNEHPLCLYLHSEPQKSSEGKVYIYFRTEESINNICNLFTEFQSDFLVNEEAASGVGTDGYYMAEVDLPQGIHASCKGFISKGQMDLPLTFGSVQRGTVGGLYFIRPLECGLKESFSVIFAAMFILSNVVRYKPAFWMEQLEGNSSGSASLAEALCNLAKRRLPNEALNAIWHEEFTYGTPGLFG